MIQQAVTQLVSGLDEGRPGLTTAHAVGSQPTGRLEGADGGGRLGPVAAVFPWWGCEAERAQPCLEVSDGFTHIARFHG